MNERIQRVAFEAFIKSTTIMNTHDLNRNDDGTYTGFLIQLRWEVWVAATDHMLRTVCNRS